MLTVFMEYKVSPESIQRYESQMESVISELKACGALDIQWYRAADQPSLYVECFQVNDQASYDTIKKNRTSPQHPVFSILNECVIGGLEKIHCWAFEKLNTKDDL
ncbi:hypothetical protein [Fictibacillus phosphorivorans]|uniref:hypothetical protein n=1 Tax=Fictibacillus phosphorivorans TaxID=1221500 RepID=UPI00129319CD|nr:hypothetical protein [Fictibacillus phosphorivorans]MQR96144.1 hypothetical protein [Fictibacillus phosphorivorans]